jgi:ABC-type Fe3+-hydroxamate transport system substrate-binding protein
LRSLPLILLLACPPASDRVDSRLHIVSLSPAVTEILVALGARDDLVGVDRFSREVSGVGDVPSLGALFSPDLERTIELAPTLVFGVAGQQQSSFFGQLRSRGVRVETLSPYTLGEVLDSYERIGALVGRPRRGSDLRRSVLRELERIRAATQDETRSVAVIIERDPLYVVGGGSFVSKLIEAAGGRNVFEDLAAPYPVVSLEVLAEREPEVLIDTSGAAGGRQWSGLPWSPRVETVRQGVVSLPGARLPEAARILRSRIHPGSGG